MFVNVYVTEIIIIISHFTVFNQFEKLRYWNITPFASAVKWYLIKKQFGYLVATAKVFLLQLTMIQKFQIDSYFFICVH